MASSRRPRTSISAITVFNSYALEDGSWIPCNVSLGSWVMMQTKKRKRARTANEYVDSYKGRVKDFRFCPKSIRVKEVLIQHAFHHRELRLKKMSKKLPLHRPNYIYPSNRVDWQPVESIIGICDVHHSYIGEQIYKGCSRGALAKRGVFFYDMYYVEPITPKGWGHLSPLALPALNSMDWASPSAATSKSYRIKMFQEIQKSLKPTTATKSVRMTMFMPIEVFVNFFNTEEVRTAPTMFICKSEESLDFLDEGWDSRQTDGVISVLQKQSIVCKLIISTQNFTCSFHYRRYHTVGKEITPLDMDINSDPENAPMSLEVLYEGRTITILSTFNNTSLAQIREDLSYEENLPLPTAYVFILKNKRVLFPTQPIHLSYISNTSSLWEYLNTKTCEH